MVAPDRAIPSTVVRGEILFGVRRMPAGRRRDALRGNADTVFAVVPWEPVPEAAADAYADLKVASHAAGTTLGENDLWIAATCVVRGARLVTRDHDFGRLPGVRVENWAV